MHLHISRNFTKSFCRVFFAALLFLPSAVWAETEAVFFNALEDVPVAPGMEELVEQTVLFDKPEGRIIESVAYMDDVTQEQALDFYHSVLPQMGWNKVSRTRFFRETEFLDIVFEDHEGKNFMRVMVKPTL